MDECSIVKQIQKIKKKGLNIEIWVFILIWILRPSSFLTTNLSPPPNLVPTVRDLAGASQEMYFLTTTNDNFWIWKHRKKTRVEMAWGFLMGRSVKTTIGERVTCLYNRLLIQRELESEESAQQLVVIWNHW